MNSRANPETAVPAEEQAIRPPRFTQACKSQNLFRFHFDSISCSMFLEQQTLSDLKIIPYRLRFRQPARTSRSVLHDRLVYFIIAQQQDDEPETQGWGEIAPLDGLSPEDPEFHRVLRRLKTGSIDSRIWEYLISFPSFRFGLEAATHDLAAGGRRIWYDSPFVRSKSTIPINGLIWMGDKDFMLEQIREKLKTGYPCLKLKIGGIHFEEEIDLLRFIRREFSADDLELRLDANGSFPAEDAKENLKRLHSFHIHSIEQPIRTGQVEEMADLCEKDIIPIALDEELIGIKTTSEKKAILDIIKPQYLIFKPSLIGGTAETLEYIELCEKRGTGWWITSALESNVGLNILAQFCGQLGTTHTQGLGTGQLFTNNVESPLREYQGRISMDENGRWGTLIEQP